MNQPKLDTGRNKWFATLMGLAMPGLGQVYNGELIKGISYFITLLVLYVLGFRWVVLLSDRMLIVGALCTVVGVLSLYIAAIVDAYRTAGRIGISFQLAAYNRWYFYVALWLLGWVLVTGAVFQFVRDNVAEAYVIPSSSMEPAILSGDRVLADKTAYRRMPPKRGDIVIMVFPDDRSKRFVKRIDALPGQTVTMPDGTKKEVPHGFAFLLGDNRQNSWDSRRFGFVPLTDLLGKVRQVYYSRGPDGIRWNRIGLVVTGQ